MNENKIPDPEQIKKEVESGTFTTFRTLLRQGIGTRTQAAFAEQTGLSRSTVSKMLNQTVIPKPEKKTLEAFASQMFSVSYTDLCLSCGYEPEDVNMIATQVRQAILDGAGALKGALAGSLREFLKQIETLYLPPIKTGWRGWGLPAALPPGMQHHPRGQWPRRPHPLYPAYASSFSLFFVWAIMLLIICLVTIWVSVLKPALPCRLFVRSVRVYVGI